MGTQCQALKRLTFQGENEIRHVTALVNVGVLLRWLEMSLAVQVKGHTRCQRRCTHPL